MSSFITAIAGDPKIAFKIGNLEVAWYGLIIVFAMLLGLIYVCREAKKINLNSDDAVELFLWVIPLAIVFARIMYIIPGRVDEYFPWNSWDDFVDFIAIWDGGITIIGGLVGGILGGVFFTLRHRKQCNFAQVADLVVVPLLTGQIIGRLGNYINQEAFGLPITDPRFQTFPFGIYLDHPQGYSSEFAEVVRNNTPGWFCATFFYEMVWNAIGLAMCFVFWQKGKNKRYPGLMIIFYFFWYMLGRLWLEFVRLDAVPVTKIACGVVFPIALVIGILYVIACESRLSYARLRALSLSGELEGAAISDFDKKNYAFVGKVLANSKNPLRLIYAKFNKESADGAKGKYYVRDVKGAFVDIDFEKLDYYRVPKNYRRRFRELKKTDSFSLNA